MIPNEFFVFDPFSPPYPGTIFWGGCRGGGVKTSLRILGVVCGFGPRSAATFFLYMDPLTPGGGPGSELRVPPVAPSLWALAREDLAVFTLDKAVQ